MTARIQPLAVGSLVALFVLTLAGGDGNAAAKPIPRRDLGWQHSIGQWTHEGIVFFRSFHLWDDNDPEIAELALARPDGRSTPLGARWDDEFCPGGASMSPDGREVAFTDGGQYGDGCDLYLVQMDGSHRRDITNTPLSLPIENNELSPTWAPDGTAIAYERADGYPTSGEDHDLLIVDVNSLSARIVAYGRGAQWSPDARRLAFTRGHSGASAVFSVARDGSSLRQLTAADGSVVSGWSPDGQRLLLERPDSPRPTVWVMDADGSRKRQLARGRWAKWAPRGGRIAFTRGGDETSLFVTNERGGPVHRVSPVAGSAYAWSPDGRRIAVTRVGPCVHMWISIVDLRGASRGLTNDCRMRGTTRSDVLTGTKEPDVIWGLAGSDRIESDPFVRPKLTRWGDRDAVWGGPGNDRIWAGRSADDVRGGPGADWISGDAESDVLFGGPGNDVLRGGPMHDQLDGGSGHDRLLGGPGVDVIRARDGEIDHVGCGSGHDRVLADREDHVSADCERVRRR